MRINKHSWLLLPVLTISAVFSLAPEFNSGASSPLQSTNNQIGRLTSSGNGLRRTSYEYDALGRTTQAVHRFEGQSRTFATGYGYPQNPTTTPGLGTVARFQLFPDNERVDYAYDASGAQQSVKTTPAGGGQQTIISSILRNARGQTIRADYGNNAITTYLYNDATNLRLNQIKTVAGVQVLQDYTYSFDPNGNLTGITDAVNSTLNATYSYDSLDQLISMFVPSTGTTLNYGYDQLGNLTHKEGVVQTYGGTGRGPHALASSGGVSYSYDLNGNLVSSSSGTTITWNTENMATRVVQGGVTMNQKSFLGEGLWKKVEPGLTTYYLPSARLENNQYRKFFAGFAERSPDGTLKFYHGDHLGSASLVTNASGASIRRQAYMPYGEDRAVSGSFTEARYQFNFKEKESTGFYDYGARLYNPATGRWLSADTLTTDGLNRYSYVSNNPLRYKDPTGHSQQDEERAMQQAVIVAQEKARAAASQGQRATVLFNGVTNTEQESTVDAVSSSFFLANTRAAAKLLDTKPTFVANLPNFTDPGGGVFKFLHDLWAAPPRPSQVAAGMQVVKPGMNIVTFSNGFEGAYQVIMRNPKGTSYGTLVFVAPHVPNAAQGVAMLRQIINHVSKDTAIVIASSFNDEGYKAGGIPGPRLLGGAFNKERYPNVRVLNCEFPLEFVHTFENYSKVILGEKGKVTPISTQ